MLKDPLKTRSRPSEKYLAVESRRIYPRRARAPPDRFHAADHAAVAASARPTPPIPHAADQPPNARGATSAAAASATEEAAAGRTDASRQRPRKIKRATSTGARRDSSSAKIASTALRASSKPRAATISRRATGGGHRASVPATQRQVKIQSPISIQRPLRRHRRQSQRHHQETLPAGKTVTVNSFLDGETAIEAMLELRH